MPDSPVNPFASRRLAGATRALSGGMGSLVVMSSHLCCDGCLTQLTPFLRKLVSRIGEFGVFPFDQFENEQRFRAAWDSVEIVRPVRYSLFTFGATDLEYFLVLSGLGEDKSVSVTRGEVQVTRAKIITPDNIQPEFQNFFEESEDQELAQFMLARSARFSNLKLHNQSGPRRIVSDSVEEIVDQLNRQLDNEDEDRVAILTAPKPLAGFAVLRYATDRILQSAPENIQELREHGFLP